VFINALRLLIKTKTINENLLIFISCVGAYIIGKPKEGLMVITLYIIGKLLEEKALNNSRKSIKDLIDIKQNYANLKTKTGIKQIDVNDINIGDILIVKKGEKIPVDGIIIKGESYLDTSVLTGESEEVKVQVNDKVLSSSINLGEIIEIKATHLFSESMVSRILELLDSATDKKTKTETFVNKIGKVYTPIVLILALLVILILPIFNISFKDSIYRGLTFLVISCPCAIAISVPLSYFTGIGVSSKRGILIKGSNYLDSLTHLKNIIFDKTGTLTNGSFKVIKIDITDPQYDKDKILKLIIKGEMLSNHPIAKSLTSLSKEKISTKDVKDFKEIEGVGISYKVKKDFIEIGSNKICDCNINASLHIKINGKHIGSIYIDDGIKENVKETITYLKENNITPYMFTGDKENIALTIGKEIGIKNVESEMLPTDKFQKYEKINRQGLTAFVGDGINDAPTLKRADIGISMGKIGSASAIEAADIVIMNDKISSIPIAIKIAKYTNYIIKENLIFALSTKTIILILSIFGLTNMWFAVFADTGVTVITIINTLRIMFRYQK
jgi:Cd2+/Zn2+-exporting ATPase